MTAEPGETGPLRSHVALIDDIAVTPGKGRDILIHVEVALDPRAVAYVLSERARFASDADALLLIGLLERGDPLDAVCVLHVDMVNPDARAVASECALRMVALAERIHTALETPPQSAEARYVWNESKGRVDILATQLSGQKKPRRPRRKE